MNLLAIKQKAQRTGFFIPFRAHFVLLIIALLLGEYWLKKNNALPQTSRTAITGVFITITSWFSLIVLILSFLSALIPWILFLINKKNNKAVLKINTKGSQKLTDKQLVEVSISNAFRPLFGYIRLRLHYDKRNISPKFAPVDKGIKKDFFSSNIRGVYNWPLNDIKEYTVNSGIIYFEDFFQFFSFATQLEVNNNFYTYPLKAATGEVPAQPKKTDDTSLRIEEMRKVEGEFLSYKNFENNDDVRRIVWKIYAKNKELVVRIPETNDPYASHIYFYASFYNSLSNEFYTDFNSVFLNTYKTFVWNIYEQLYSRNEYIKFIPDQQTKSFYADDPLQKVRHIISTSSWQATNEPVNYFNKQYGSVLCLSSLTDVGKLNGILDKSGKSLTIIFIELSKSFKKARTSDRLQWLFVKPEKKGTDSHRLAFAISSLRKKLINNETKIKELLGKSDCETVIITEHLQE